MERRHIVISGHVQGVFFRSSTQDIARDAGCTGWARNLPDGRVEVEVQGPPDAVERVLDHCRTGPPHARVEAVEVERVPLVDDEPSFRSR